MFETATLSYGSSGKRVWTTAMGFTGQALLVACALLAPMISPQALPRVAWLVSIAPPGPPPPPPLPPGQQSATHSPAPVSQFRNGILLIPKTIPKGPMILEDPELPAFSDGPGVPGGVPLGREGGAPGGILSDLLSSAARTLPVLRPPEPVHHDLAQACRHRRTAAHYDCEDGVANSQGGSRVSRACQAGARFGDGGTARRARRGWPHSRIESGSRPSPAGQGRDRSRSPVGL